MNKYQINKRIITSAAAILFIASACKQVSNNNKQNTIDNLSRADVNKLSLNSCGYETPASSSKELLIQTIVANTEGANDVAVKDALTKTLRAAPEEMLKMFSTDLKGKFVVNAAKTATECAKVLSKDEKAFEKEFMSESTSNAPISCWKAPDNSGPVIYIGAGKLANNDVSLVNNVRHNSIRLLGYIYSQFIPSKLALRIKDVETALAQSQNRSSSDRATLEALKLQLQGTADKFVANRKKLKEEFFADLAQMGSPAVARLNEFANKAGETFESFVLAEAFDSHYCSVSVTRRNFKASTPRTSAAFAVFGAELGE